MAWDKYERLNGRKKFTLRQHEYCARVDVISEEEKEKKRDLLENSMGMKSDYLVQGGVDSRRL